MVWPVCQEPSAVGIREQDTMNPAKAQKIVLVCVISIIVMVVAGDAAEGKTPKPARFLAVGFVTLLLIGGVELAPGLAAAFAMVAVTAVALERLGPVASRVAGVVGGSVPLGSLSPITEEQLSTVATTSTERPGPGNRAKGEQIVREARKFLGVPYVWGGSEPNGFDCSGFTSYVYKHCGITIPRVAADQQNAGSLVNNPEPGDLVFFGRPAHHVGIYYGDNKMIDAPHSGTVVQIQSLAGRTDQSGFRRYY